ncbi:hypothetical protein HYV11_02330 [Candidatus Dependentiae bacterium]|nr:hypothetical protein [Candidatus Dependentiae bacterium]
MKKIFIIVCFAQAMVYSFPGLPQIKSLVSYGVGLGGYWELSPTYYPKTVAYFDALKKKYPVLNNKDIIILDGPMADNNTIYFPMKWIEKLELGNKFYLDVTEWIILHELGHIEHMDMYKTVIGLGLFYGGYAIVKKELEGIIMQPNETLKKATIIMTCGGLFLTYCLATREYYADDYAMQHCDNPEAWIAAYEFLDRFAPLGWMPGILHSFTKFRLSRIAKAFKNKFGYDLVVVPQSLQPIYVS